MMCGYGMMWGGGMSCGAFWFLNIVVALAIIVVVVWAVLQLTNKK